MVHLCEPGNEVNIHYGSGKSLFTGSGASAVSETGCMIEAMAGILISEAGGSVQLTGDSQSVIKAKPTGKTYPRYPDAPEEGSYNGNVSIERAAYAVVGGTVAVVSLTAGAAAHALAPVMTNVAIGSVAVTSVAGVGLMASDYANESVSSQTDYMAAALEAEMIFLTNEAGGLAARRFGMGRLGRAVLPGVASAGVDAGYQKLRNGEVDWGSVAGNLVVNVTWNGLTDPFGPRGVYGGGDGVEGEVEL